MPRKRKTDPAAPAPLNADEAAMNAQLEEYVAADEKAEAAADAPETPPAPKPLADSRWL